MENQVFEIGDHVIIRPDLSCDVEFVVDEMTELRGKEVTIIGVRTMQLGIHPCPPTAVYDIDVDGRGLRGFFWTEEMLIPFDTSESKPVSKEDIINLTNLL